MSDNTRTNNKRAPWVRMASAYYRSENGENPKLADANLYTFDPILDELIEEHLIDYDLPITPCIDGHNVMTTTSTPSFLNTNVKVPLSPNFVRDLAGRIIYIGYGPEIKKTDQWDNNRHVTFPKNCRVVTNDIDGSEYIENIFLTRFRTLDVSIFYEDDAHQKLFCYKNENHYPYKLRLDTFYQDGWRLPQTNMLYARKSVEQSKANTIGQKFIDEWENSKDILSYPEFLEKNGGDEWLNKLFQAGCTIIPTHEAYNSYYIVNSEYEIEKRGSGVAVQGLHQILDEKASSEPKGTIIEVIRPGYITSTHIEPAQVIVSDGMRYDASKKAYPLPMHPDLRLPHQRTQCVWGATWLPTHPAHFDAPAIWGWDMATGHFLQMTGPLWDPLHYYYESTPLVIRAFKDPSPTSKHIAKVPEDMKDRFYPATSIKGFDMISYNTLKMRLEKDIHPKSAIVRVNDADISSSFGYHPLPYNYEYELNHIWFPELMPSNRTPLMPQNIKTVPVIESYLTPDYYLANTPDENEEERLIKYNLLSNTSSPLLKKYPQLNRYLSEFDADKAKEAGLIILNIPSSLIEDVSTLYASDDIDNIIKATEMPFYRAVKEMRIKSLKELNKHIEDYNSDIQKFLYNYWKASS